MKKTLHAGLLALWTPCAALAGQGVGPALYTVPFATFVENPTDDRVVTIDDTSGSIATVQDAIDAARAAHPEAVIVMRLARGVTYPVSAASLVLSTRQCLLADGAILRAATPDVIVPLIAVAEGSTKVSVSGGTLDGNGASILGIDVPGASRVNVDKVTIVGCRRGGVRLQGHGNTVFNNEMTVTRSDVSGSIAGAGISVENATQALLVDNHTHQNAAGIRLAGAWARVVNNVSAGNGVGIDVASGNDNIVANNTCAGNATGIRAAGTKGMIVSNRVDANTSLGIESVGTTNTFIDNRLTSGNATDFSSGGSGNNVIAYGAPLSAPDQNYFYPPLVDNPHTDATVVRGMGRTDITVSSASLDDVQIAYDAARAANPGDAIVLHLSGGFTVGARPLVLASNTSVLLNGTIQVDAATTAKAVVQVPSGRARVSLSGGIIDGADRVGILGIEVVGASMVQVDGMTIRNFGDNTVHNNLSDSVRFRNGVTPYVVTRCTIDKSGARGIWLQAGSTKGLYADNTVTRTRAGIDADSGSFGAVMLFNRLDRNTYGVFIEQGASHNTAIGNQSDNSDRYNVDLYNNAHSPEVRYNVVACNRLNGGRTAIRSGSTPDGSRTSWNFLFNNVVRNAPVLGRADGVENYYSQNILEGSALTTSGSETFFNPPAADGGSATPTPTPTPGPTSGTPTPTPTQTMTPTPTPTPTPSAAPLGPNLALNKPATASTIWSATYNAAKAFDGSDSTRWSAAAAQATNQWLAVDLLEPSAYNCVVMKEISYVRVTSHVLQMSDDGVTYTDIPDTASTTIGPSKRTCFATVRSRYFRFLINEARQGAGLKEPTVNEVAVHFQDRPPVLGAPEFVVAEATGPSGAAVEFTVTALDEKDGALPVLSTPPSGSVFPLGTTEVTARATDSAGQTVTVTFEVVVNDTTPPVLTLPLDIAVETNDPAGRAVHFAASAQDVVSGPIVVTLSPDTGHLFPIGTTTVSATAVDAAGNRATGTFTVTVRIAAWTSARQAYAVGQVVVHGAATWKNIQAHRSQSDWPPHLTPALWVKVPAGNEWDQPVQYAVGHEVLFGGARYRCRQAHTSQAGWTPPATPALWTRSGP